MAVIRVLLLFLAAIPLLTLILLGGGQVTSLLADPAFLPVLRNTLLLAGAAALLGVALAVPAVAAVAAAPPAARRMFAVFFALPLLMPPSWVGQGLRAFAHQAPVPGATLAALVLAHAGPGAAFAALILLGMLRPDDLALRATAEANGAGYWRAWSLALGSRGPRALCATACAAFAGAATFSFVDTALAPPTQPTLGALLGSMLAAGDDPSPGPALILALLSVVPAALIVGLGAWPRRP